MKSIAFLISTDYEQELKLAEGKFFNEYYFLKELFRHKDYILEKVIWDQEKNWDRFSAIIFKSIWDYYKRPDDFIPFLYELKNSKAKFCNSLATTKWNMNKSYFKDIEMAGLPVIPFKIISEQDELNLSLFQSIGKELVIKPTISGGSRHTIKMNAEDWLQHLSLMKTILKESELLIQPYVCEVADVGEYSFLFFGGEFSHALLKKPKQGDFRAHSFFGGNNFPYNPSTHEINEVKRFLLTAPDFPDYARIDVVKRNETFYLMELELIEPYLYLETATNKNLSGEKFVNAITKGLNS